MITTPQLKEILALPSRFYAQKPQVFSIEYLEELKAAILNSPYLGNSQLSDNFSGTKGFSVVFKRSGIAQVIQELPYLQSYLEIALKKTCNAFYLNPLILESGNEVKPHVDCSISSYDMVMTIPNLVSVLYVQVPKDIQGGELVLQAQERLLKVIPPEFNTLLYFLGNLTHSVKPFYSLQPRISLICEQYNLEPARLNSIPELEIMKVKK